MIFPKKNTFDIDLVKISISFPNFDNKKSEFSRHQSFLNNSIIPNTILLTKINNQYLNNHNLKNLLKRNNFAIIFEYSFKTSRK